MSRSRLDRDRALGIESGQRSRASEEECDEPDGHDREHLLEGQLDGLSPGQPGDRLVEPAAAGGAAQPACPPRRPARAQPLRHRGAARERRPGRGAAAVSHLRRLPPGPDRSADGHGRQSLRPQRAHRRDRARAAARADAAEPPRGRQPAAVARRVQARDQPQRARRLLDPVPEPRLVRPRRERAGHLHRHRARRKRRVARGHADAAARDQSRPHPHLDLRPAADLRQHRHPLVGPVAGLRLDRGAQPRPALGRGREAPADRRRDAAQRGRPAPRRRRPDRLLRQLLDRALAPAHPVRQGAQLDLRPPQGLLSDLGRRAAVPDRAAGELGPEREDPHGRVDARGSSPTRCSSGR